MPITRISSYPHGGVQRSRNLIILFQPRAATQNLGQPELANGTLHVLNLPLYWCWRLDPLGWLTANTTDHVGMGQGLWRALCGLQVQCRGNWLGDTRMQRRRATGDNERSVGLVSSHGPVPSGRANEGRVVSE